MKKILLLGLLTTFCVGFSQQAMLMPSGKKINATPEWQFVCENYTYQGYLNIQIGKTEKGGVVKLLIKTSSDKLIIGDRIYIFLKNGSFVYCTDKGNRTYADGISSNFYTVTDAEIKLFTQQNITDVRFKIIGSQKSFDSQIGFFTASNIPTVFDAYSKEVVAIDTKIEIKKLL
jgi:hypothetical protein